MTLRAPISECAQNITVPYFFFLTSSETLLSRSFSTVFVCAVGKATLSNLASGFARFWNGLDSTSMLKPKPIGRSFLQVWNNQKR